MEYKPTMAINQGPEAPRPDRTPPAAERSGAQPNFEGPVFGWLVCAQGPFAGMDRPVLRAVTYIGNGPNFMVKAVADSAGVAMPSFGGYVVWAFTYLVPTLVAMVCIFIADGLLWTVIGLVLTAGLLVRALLMARRFVHPIDAELARRR